MSPDELIYSPQHLCTASREAFTDCTKEIQDRRNLHEPTDPSVVAVPLTLLWVTFGLEDLQHLEIKVKNLARTTDSIFGEEKSDQVILITNLQQAVQTAIKKATEIKKSLTCQTNKIVLNNNIIIIIIYWAWQTTWSID